MYKDKDKQREAQRNWVRQKRAAKGSTNEARTSPVVDEVKAVGSKAQLSGHDVIHERIFDTPKRGKDIKCFKDLPPDVQATINRVSESNEEKQKRTAVAIKYQHTFGAGAYYPHGAVCTGTVTGKPGDVDYNGICTPEWRAERGR